MLPKRALGATDLRVSVLGFGASPLGGVFGERVPVERATDAVHEAFAHGVNLFDTSPFYGVTESERVLGGALRGLERDDYVLASKVGRYDADEFDFSAARVERSVRESMQRLGTRRLDIVQCHDVEFAPDPTQIADETLPALARLRDEGLVGAIGLTGLPLDVYRRALERTAVHVDVALSYCHYCLNDTSLVDSGTLEELRAGGLGVINAAPVAMGLLTERGPPAWHPAPPELRRRCAEAARVCRERFDCDIAQLALQFALREERVASTLVGVDSRDTLERNLAACNAPVNEAALDAVRATLQPVHNVTWPSGTAKA